MVRVDFTASKYFFEIVCFCTQGGQGRPPKPKVNYYAVAKMEMNFTNQLCKDNKLIIGDDNRPDEGSLMVGCISGFVIDCHKNVNP